MSEDLVRVLIVDDEESFIEALAVGLSREGFEIEVAKDGEEALNKFRESEPDIVLLDLMMPKISGIDVCRAIRTTSSVPIIMLTAKGTEVDTVVGLEVGADDYITKPYKMSEVLARLRAVLRRSRVADPARARGPENLPAHQDKLVNTPGIPSRASQVTSLKVDFDPSASLVEIGDVSLDFERHEVFVRGQEVRLPLKEFELLEILMLNGGRVMTRDALIESIWGDDYVGDTKTLDVHIKRLRSRIEVDPAHPTHITTIRGVGYRFEERVKGR